MKTQLLITRLVGIALTAILFVSCKKDDTYCNIKRPFKAKIDTWYRVSPTDPQIVVVNGTTYVGFAYFPGGGIGNVTHMGNAPITLINSFMHLPLMLRLRVPLLLLSLM